MKKIVFALSAASLALMTSCQNEAQESVLTLADEVTVNFGMDLGIANVELTRAEHNFTYYIAVSADAASDGAITSGYVGRFSSLSDASLALKANTSYTFYISAFESLGDAIDLSSVCATEGEFVEVSEAVSYAPDFADLRVDRYYGSTTETLEGNTTISVEGKRYVYGIKVNIEKPSTGHVTLTSDSPALSYNVASNATDAVVEQNIFCMAGTDPEGSKTTLVTVTLFDKSDKKVSSVSKEITIARNHSKTLTVKAIDPLASFDFTVEEGDMTVEEEDMTPVVNMHMGHEYVDLGVTDEQGRTIYWAICNVGADNPEDYGLYFAWGDTEGHSVDINEWEQPDGYSYNWAHTPFNNGSSSFEESSFNSVKDEVCPDGILALAYDAAHVQWGGNWRMPTTEEQDALRTQCTMTWDSVKKGYTVKGKGSDGNSIFLPASGYRYYSNFRNAGSNGYYWSSSLYASTLSNAYHLSFDSSGHDRRNSYRYYGFAVRPVLCSAE